MNRGFAPDLSVYAFSVATTKQEKPKKVGMKRKSP